jgi:energy-coupling factor transporter transmembrane protein EcfT
VTGWRDSRLFPEAFRASLSAYGYLFLVVGTVVAAVVAREVEVVLVLAAVVVLAGLLCRRALRLFLRWQLWAFVLPTLALSPLLIGERDILVAGLMVSREGFWAGLWMVTRALSIALASAVFTSAVSIPEMAKLFERMRLKGLGFALGVATNLLPTIQETMETSYQAIRLRGGFRLRRLQTMKLLLIAVIAGPLRRSDDIVWAAEARAFDPDKLQTTPIPLARADVALGVLMSALALTLLVL